MCRGKVVKGMSAALKSMKPERISAILDKFEQQFEDLDVCDHAACLTFGLVWTRLSECAFGVVWRAVHFSPCLRSRPVAQSMFTFWRKFGVIGDKRLHGGIDGQLLSPDNT